MKAAGMIPLANGGIRYDDGMKFEIALAGISPESMRAISSSIPSLEGQGSPGCVRTASQVRQHDETRTSRRSHGRESAGFRQGRYGHGADGRLGARQFVQAGATLADFSSGPAPQESGPPCFDLNADCFIFWKPKGADLEAGQKLFAETVMQPSTQEMYSKITGSIPARTDVNLAAEGFTGRAAQLGAEFA